MWEQYIEQHGRRLYGLCMTLCRDPFAAEDLYQETWLRALRGFARYDPARPFAPWITRICVNAYRSGRRRAAQSPLFDGFADSQAKDAALAAAPAPVDRYMPLRKAIDALPARLRTAVILFYFLGMDVAETAGALGVPAGTVKSRLHKSRALLKEVLQDESDLRL